MGAAAHLGIQLRDYDARIRTFIPRYEEMLDAAAAVLTGLDRRPSVVVDLGVGTGALAAKCAKASPRAQIIGIDSDAGMLALARARLRRRFSAVRGDFLSVALPRCDAIVASFALHHTPTQRRKRALYARCFSALRRGGVLVNADCSLAMRREQRTQDHAAWRAHLTRVYSGGQADKYLRTWAREDVYLSLDDEVSLLRSVGFAVDVAWRIGSFAVVVAMKRR